MVTKKKSRHSAAKPRLLSVDLGLTAAVLRKEMGSVRDYTLETYREHGRIRDDVSDEELLNGLAEARVAHAPLGETHADREVYWLAVNSWLCSKYSKYPRFAYKYAQDIRKAYLAVEHFTVSRIIIHAVRRLSLDGVRVVIASNSTQEEAERILRHFSIEKEFDAVYTSDMLGVRKPNPRFWELILERERELGFSYKRGVHVGNSLYSDSGAAELPGWLVHIVDRDGRYHPHSPQVELDAQFSEGHAEFVRNGIRHQRIRFSASRRELAARLIEPLEHRLKHGPK